MKREEASFYKYIIILLEIICLIGIYLTSTYSYILFHSIAELFSIAIAFGIFILSWNSRDFMKNNYLLFIGIAYLFIGSIDLLHTISYRGMGVFEEYGSNLPTQLWIGARYIQSVTFILAAVFFKKKINPYLILFSYLLITVFLLLSIFYFKIFPVCYIEGKGLTDFKKISEYIISLFLLISIFLLSFKKNKFSKNTYYLITISIIITISSELAFTAYFGVYDFLNLTGHSLKIIAFYLIYRAIIKTGLTTPYSLLFRDLQLSKEKYQDLAENLQDGILVLNKNFNITYINPKMTDWLGYLREEMLGKKLSSFIKIDPPDNSIEKLVNKKAAKKARYDFKFIKKDGSEIYLAMETSSIIDNKGKFLGLLSAVQDMTKIRNAENNLLKEKKECEDIINIKTSELIETQKELSKAKRLSDIGTLAATIAHELRNPLGVIQIACYNIRKKRENSIIDKHIDNIEKKVSESARIIDNLLNYSRIKMPSLENTNLYNIITESLESLGGMNNKTGIQIIKKIDDIKELTITADPLQLKEVFNNILNNAYQAFPENKGKIEITSEVIENKKITIKIKDNGTGISSDDLDMVFKPFYTNKSKGTGLGLTICYELIDLHEGTIKINSKEGKGTTVIIELPIE